MTPHETLKMLGACGKWMHRARGKTWRQLFADLRAIDPESGEADSAWSFLGMELSGYGRIGGRVCGCLACTDSTAVAHGSLPFEAWMDALRMSLAERRAARRAA